MSTWTRLIPLAEATEGRGKVVPVAGRSDLAVFLLEGLPRVLENRCPHRDGDLGEGDVFKGQVYCPLHAWPFDLVSGQCTRYPQAKVQVFEARIHEGHIEALLPDGPSYPT